MTHEKQDKNNHFDFESYNLLHNSYPSEKEKKLYLKACRTWRSLHDFIVDPKRSENPLMYARFIGLEMAREGGPRKTILRRLLNRYYLTTMHLVLERLGR